MNDDIPPTPKPAVILDSMRAELIRMRKVVEEADKLRPKIKRAERFIKNFAETWSLPVPEETRIVVPTKPKPVGIRVDDRRPRTGTSGTLGPGHRRTRGPS